MTKVHKSCDISRNEVRPVVLSLGEPARRLAGGSPHADRLAAACGPVAVSGRIAAASVDGLAASGDHQGGLAGIDPQQVRQAAERLLAQTESEAGRLIREARQLAADIAHEARAAGHEAGHAAGYAAGYAAGHEAGSRQASLEQTEQSRRMAEQVQSVVGDLERRNRQQLEQLEPEILELSLQVAEKVIGRELSRNDEAFRSLVRAALARIRQSERICVRVNDRDADWLADGVADGLPAVDSVEVKGDSQLPAGTCLIETDSGLIDASVPVQMRRIREKLQEARA